MMGESKEFAINSRSQSDPANDVYIRHLFKQGLIDES